MDERRRADETRRRRKKGSLHAAEAADALEGGCRCDGRRSDRSPPTLGPEDVYYD